MSGTSVSEDYGGSQEEGRRLAYFSEMKAYRRPLAAACLGMASGFLLNHYIANIFAPHLIREFDWSRGDFAFIGAIGLANVLVLPMVGRLVDLFGTKRVAAVGVAGLTASFFAYAFMSGSLVTYFVITTLQLLSAGATTSSTVYSRLIAERFVTARGTALSIAATSPALVGLLCSPLLQQLIASHGWRTGYVVVAAYVGIVGGIAIFLAPGKKKDASPSRPKAAHDYAEIFRAKAFWIMAGGMLLCNLVYPLQSTQLAVMAEEHGVGPGDAAMLISLFAAGVMVGRIACGLALDRYSAPIVAMVAFALPSIGLLLVFAGFTALPVLAAAIAMIGISLGAESDLAAYLVVRHFRIEIYGTVLGLIVTTIALASSIGSIVLGLTLKAFGTFDPYLAMTGVAHLLGGALFLLLRSQPLAPTESLAR